MQFPGQSWLEDVVALVYPNLCLSCQLPLVKGESFLCTLCKHDLPETNFHLEPDNPVAKHFWGRIKLEGAASFYYFTGKSRVQHLLHQLKYNKKPEVGIELGKLYGRQLLLAKPYNRADVVVPVPLHPKKEHLRGYNQAAKFASGLGQGLNIAVANRALKRSIFTQSQTKKTRAERVANVSRAFEVAQPGKLKNKHVLLVDDVVTTGATLEACAQSIAEVPGTTISVATIACAYNF